MKCPKCGENGTSCFNFTIVNGNEYYCTLCKGCEDKDFLMEKQKDKCYICDHRIISLQYSSVDHGHLICPNCKNGLAGFDHDMTRVHLAYDYLRMLGEL